MRACSVHYACVQCAHWVRVCSVLNSGFQCVQCINGWEPLPAVKLRRFISSPLKPSWMFYHLQATQSIVIHFFTTIIPTMHPFGIRFASRFDEYFFQFRRMPQNNASSFGVKGFLTHLRHYVCQHFFVAEGQWDTPCSKRGAPHRLLPHSSSAPHNFTDAKLMSWVNEGLKEAMLLWMNELGVKDIMMATNPEELYIKLIHHFPWHESDKDPSFEEVHNKNYESDEFIDVDEHDEEDNQGGAMLIDHLVRLAPCR